MEQYPPNSAFNVPIPTNANPIDAVMLRFQAWRKVLKDNIGYFREVQQMHEVHSKCILTPSEYLANLSPTPTFMKSGGLNDALSITQELHRQSLADATTAKAIEATIIAKLTGLRNDLHHKLREIRSLAPDFRNNVDREVEATRRAVKHLQDALTAIDSECPTSATRADPFIVRLSVDRQLTRQIEEENYLHLAYQNLEYSARNLECLIVEEIQRAYATYADILEREAETRRTAAARLRNGPIALPPRHEWQVFASSDSNLIDPDAPIRTVESVTYPGREHSATKEIRSGILQRKSKYLKSYTSGYYVLSSTYLHEFRLGDNPSQAPIMSLYLPDQNLGAHSDEASSSYKFILKGRQAGSLHHGHVWVFKAESREDMLAWHRSFEPKFEQHVDNRVTRINRSHELERQQGIGSGPRAGS
ncbi:hypothetical protein KEM52_004999 [Ascosphaera acerosa]|nr:hypothetical protein KEM52_004999 [Ascosphaera acerosa]